MTPDPHGIAIMDARSITRRILDRAMRAPPAEPATPRPSELPLLARGERLPVIADRNVFIVEAYRAILRRDPAPDEVMREARRLRFLPFLFTRTGLLLRLRSSLEAMRLERIDRAERDALHARRFARLEAEHRTIREQLKVLQHSLSAVSYGIVDEVRRPLTALSSEILDALRRDGTSEGAP